VEGRSSSSDTPGGAFIRRLSLGLLGLQWWMPPRQRGDLIWIASIFQLFNIITKCIHSFSYSKVRKKMALAEKELQQAKDNQTLTRYIHARRKEEAQKKEEVQKKAEEEAWKMAMWWPGDPMKVKAPRMSGLGESSPPSGPRHLLPPVSYYVSFVEWLLL
jgi:hypothetical protein